MYDRVGHDRGHRRGRAWPSSPASSLAVVLARMLARPLAEVGAAARRIADGDYAARVPREGPEELASLADSFNQMAASLRAPGGDAARLHRQRRARAADAADQPAGLPRGAARRRHRRRPGDLRLALGGGRAARPAVALARRAGRGRRRDRAAARSSELDLAAAIRTALELAQPTLERAGLDVVVDVPGHACPPAPTPTTSPRSSRNLLSNAARYTPAGGTVTVRAERRPADLLVSIVEHRRGHPGRGPRPRLRALLPRREVARPGARRRRHRPGHRQAARRGRRRPGRRRVARTA